MIAPEIIFEDSQILVIDKPSGVVVNRAESVKEETVQDWAEKKLEIENCPAKRDPALREKLKIASDFVRRAGTVHRLDKETSGLLVIAKTPGAFEDLKAQFKQRKVKKKYLALVYGKMESRQGEISLPIKRLAWDRKKFGIVPGGKKSRTKYRLITHYPLPITCLPAGIAHYSYLEMEPETGRTHQIRVHFKHLSHPLVGDLKYAGRRVKKDKEFCPRLFLHASHLSFAHPKTKKKMEFKSALPQDLEKTLQGLNKAQ